MKTLKKILAVTFIFTGTFYLSGQTVRQSIKPGGIWPDNNGMHINAHGGGILKYKGTFYWYGEHKVEGKAGNVAMAGVHCYSSKDLYNWKDEGIALAVSEDPESMITKGCVIERPKVIYNDKTKKFVMWFHHELKGMGYKAAKTGVALADNAAGPFHYLESINPNAGQWPLNFTDDQKNHDFPCQSEGLVGRMERSCREWHVCSP